MTHQQTVAARFAVATLSLLGLCAAAEAQSRILTVSPGGGSGRKGALFEIDGTGHRTVLTDFGGTSLSLIGRNKKQPKGKLPTDVAIARDGSIFVVDALAGKKGQLFAINPTTGARVILSDFGDPGQGPTGERPSRLVTGADGGVLVVDLIAGWPAIIFILARQGVVESSRLIRSAGTVQ